MPSHRSSRRRFLQGSLSAAAVLASGSIVKSETTSPAEKLNLAFVGVAGKGADALNQFASLDCNYVALCDIDSNNLGHAAAAHQGARAYTDFRKMLEQQGHRRRRHQHPRPQPRRRRDGRDATRQTRLLRKAAHA